MFSVRIVLIMITPCPGPSAPFYSNFHRMPQFNLEVVKDNDGIVKLYYRLASHQQ